MIDMPNTIEVITICKQELPEDDGRPDVYKNPEGKFFRVVFRDKIEVAPNSQTVKAICIKIKERTKQIFIAPELAISLEQSMDLRK